METRSDVHCTNCGRDFIATLDLALNGNHEITCPYCQHVHYRVVRDGEVTEERWQSSGGPIYVATTSTITVSPTFLYVTTAATASGTTTSGTTTGGFATSAWLNRTDLAV